MGAAGHRATAPQPEPAAPAAPASGSGERPWEASDLLVGAGPGGALPPAAIEKAAETFLRHGICVLQDAVEPELVQRCATCAAQSLEGCRARLQELGVDMENQPFSFREVVHRSRGRFDMQLLPGTACAPVDEPTLEDEAPWLPLLRRLLGHDARRLFTGAVVSSPGAEAQEAHMDGFHLFGQEEAEGAIQCPPHCLTIFVPLIDVNMQNGPTEFWPGTHRLSKEFNGSAPSFAPELPVGSAVLFDYRLIHRGLPNCSGARRPVLYMVWARSWFNDCVNFPPQSLFPGAAA